MPQIDNTIRDSSNGARVESNQFSALSKHIDGNGILSSVQEIRYFQTLRVSDNFDHTRCSKWLLSGWNSEHLLRTTLERYDPEDMPFALHWLFPMAYYSVYAVFLAFLEVKGDRPSNHSKTINVFGELVSQDKYPEKLSFYASGTKKNIEFGKISMHLNESVLRYNPDDPDSVEDQICHFLKPTREHYLKEKREKLKGKFKTKDKKKKIGRGSRIRWVILLF